MGGKLSKKKKGYNVNDDKTKDAKAEGAGPEDNQTLKDNKDEAAASADAKEAANDTVAKEAPVKEENATKELEKSATNAEPKTDGTKNAKPAKPEETTAAPKEPPPAAKEVGKDEADAKKTEAPKVEVVPKAESPPAVSPDPKATAAPAKETPSSTAAPEAPPKEANATEAPSKDQSVAAQD